MLGHFWLLLWNRWTEFNETSTKFVLFWPIGKSRWPSWSLTGWDIFDFFSATTERDSMKLNRKKGRNVFYGVFLFFFFFFFFEGGGVVQDRNISISSIKFMFLRINLRKQDGRLDLSWSLSTKCMFFRPIGKTRWPPWTLIGWDISISPLPPLNGIQENLTGGKFPTSSTKFVFFESIIFSTTCVPFKFEGFVETTVPEPGMTSCELYIIRPIWALCIAHMTSWFQQKLSGSRKMHIIIDFYTISTERKN